LLAPFRKDNGLGVPQNGYNAAPPANESMHRETKLVEFPRLDELGQSRDRLVNPLIDESAVESPAEEFLGCIEGFAISDRVESGHELADEKRIGLVKAKGYVKV
jgi:hypothetical protein